MQNKNKHFTRARYSSNDWFVDKSSARPLEELQSKVINEEIKLIPTEIKEYIEFMSNHYTSIKSKYAGDYIIAKPYFIGLLSYVNSFIASV